MGPPESSIFFDEFSISKSIQLWGYHHDYGHLHFWCDRWPWVPATLAQRERGSQLHHDPVGTYVDGSKCAIRNF